MIFVLLAPSGAGKNYYLDKLMETNLNLTKVITYTTRPMRSSEVDGREYYFTTNPHMRHMISEGDILAPETYHVHGGHEWLYGIHKLSLSNPNEDYLLILEPNGFRTITNIFGDKVLGFYIDRDVELRREDYIKRDSNSSVLEFERREEDDKPKFDKVKGMKNIYFIDNNDFSKTDDRIKLISDIMKEYMNE